MPITQLHSQRIQDAPQSYGKSRQAIINGNFDVWQRSTSDTAGGYNTADRWYITRGGGTTATTSRQAFTLGQSTVPNNPKYFLRYDRTVSGATSTIEQRIEGVATFSGTTATLSFWAKADSATTLDVYMEQFFGTGGSPSSTVTTATQSASLTTSWQQFKYTFTLASISGKTLGTAGDDFLAPHFSLDVGQGNHAIDIAQVQLCAGSEALPFEPKSIGQEKDDCFRYYWETTGTWTIMGRARSATDARVTIQYPTEMRTNPTMTYDSISSMRVLDGTTLRVISALSATYIDRFAMTMTATTTGMTASNAVGLYLATNKVQFSAEL